MSRPSYPTSVLIHLPLPLLAFMLCPKPATSISDLSTEPSAMQLENLTTLGFQLYDQNQLAQSREIFCFLVTARQQQMDWIGAREALFQLVVICSDLQQPTQALKYARAALRMAKVIGDDRCIGESWNVLGGVYRQMQDFEAALECYQEALAAYQNTDCDEDLASALNNLGLTYGNLGQFEQMQIFCGSAAAMLEETGNLTEQASAICNTGVAYAQLGNEELALELMTQALTLWTAAGDTVGEAIAFGHIGDICRRCQLWGKALIGFQRALVRQTRLGDRQQQAHLLRQIARLYEHQGAQQSALAYYEKALEIAQVLEESGEVEEPEAPKSGLVKHILQDLMRVYEQLGQLDKAFACCRAIHAQAIALAGKQTFVPPSPQ